ncbi:hypothetical protein FRC07_007008, partial [Ceratobasidium sp. 392]
MMSSLGGTEEDRGGLCHPACTLHGRTDRVSQRTFRRCVSRIQTECWKQAAIKQDAGAAGPSTGSSIAIPAQSALDAAQLSAVADELDAELEPPPPDLNDEDDPTMPSWGVTTGAMSDRFGYGGQDQEASGSEADILAAEHVGVDHSCDVEISEKESSSSGSSVAPEWSTDFGYSSGSEADVDSDAESNPELDDLIPISPARSQTRTPEASDVNIGDMEDIELEVPATPAPLESPESANAAPAPQVNSETPAASANLPDALRAYRELVLKLASDGDLTVIAANAFLKTLNMCLEKDLLRCGPHADPAHRLPVTLETLRKQVDEPSDMLKIYVMCPDFDCQKLKELSLLDLDQPHTCSNPKCKKPITRQKTIRRRGSSK